MQKTLWFICTATAQSQIRHQRFQLVAITVSYNALILDTKKAYATASVVVCPLGSQNWLYRDELAMQFSHGKSQSMLKFIS